MVVAVLLVSGAAVVLQRQQVEDPGVTLAPTPTPTRTPATERTEPQRPAPTPPAEAAETPLGTPGERPEGIDEIAAQVAELRGLPYDDPLDARVLAPADLGAKYAELAFSEYDPVQIAADQRLLVALRLVPSDTDLRAVVEELYREQVLGLYVPEEKVLYIGAEGPTLSEYARITAAHEVLHSLQDRAFGLEEALDMPEAQADAQLALLSLVEGDAVLVQQLWSTRHQTEAQRRDAMAEAARRETGALARAPRYVRESLLFPYSNGAQFVAALFEQGGFDAIDEAFANPPTTTAQILHPQRYLSGEGAADVTITADPGSGWEESSTYTFGEFDLREMLHDLGPQGPSIANGWNGGLTTHWQRGADDAVALALSFRTQQDAAAACDAVPDWYDRVAGGRAAGESLHQGDRDWMAWSCTPTEVRIGIGPDGDIATTLSAG